MRTSEASSGASVASSTPPIAAIPRGANVLPEHGGVLEQPALVRLEPVEPGGDQGVQGLRHVEGREVAGHRVARLPALEQTAVEQHAHRLDRVQRDAVRAVADTR